MPSAVVMANTMNKLPPIIPMTFSLKYLDNNTPPATATPVAVACAAMAPVATASGFIAALSAIVEKKERSPISAANTSPNVCNKLPIIEFRLSSLDMDFSMLATDSSARR